MSEHEASRSSSTMAPMWPDEVDLSSWYREEQEVAHRVVDNAVDLSVWTLESKRENVVVYTHCKNNEAQTFGIRSITKVPGTIAHVIEALRTPTSILYKQHLKTLHPKLYLDSEVLFADIPRSPMAESMTMKWMAFSSPKTLKRSKEMLVREYCCVRDDHPEYGSYGICRSQSYNGPGAKFSIRAKAGTYSMAVMESSGYVVLPAQEEGYVCVTLTMYMRKARDQKGVSPGIKAMSTKLATDLVWLGKTLQNSVFESNALADKWVRDGERKECQNCQQPFGVLKRKHHCRVCGEVVCANCTTFKPLAHDQEKLKMRVCKSCLTKPMPSSVSSMDIGGSFCSSDSRESTKSDDARYYSDDAMSESLRGSSGPPAPSPQLLRNSSGVGRQLSTTNSMSSITSSEQPTLRRKSSSREMSTTSGSSRSRPPRVDFFNDDFEELCLLAMETLECPMAGIRTDEFELVRYADDADRSRLSRSLPTFRRMAQKGKPCIVLDVSNDKRITSEKRFAAKLQFFVGVPLNLDGEVIGDLCVADAHARSELDDMKVDVLQVLGETATKYMMSIDYQHDLENFRKANRKDAPSNAHLQSLQSTVLDVNDEETLAAKEIAF